jgi:hypothetical protein
MHWVLGTPHFTLFALRAVLVLSAVLCDRICGLVVRVPGYTTECIVLSVRYELNLYMLCRRK